MREGGTIINLSTSVKKLALPTYALYAASKGGAVDAIGLVTSRRSRVRPLQACRDDQARPSGCTSRRAPADYAARHSGAQRRRRMLG